MINRVTAIAFGVLFIIVVGLGIYVDHLKGANRALALRSYNDSAALDTSRRVALSRKDSMAILGDSLAAVTKLAIQVRQSRDKLDKALGEEKKASAVLSLRLDSLTAHQVQSTGGVIVTHDTVAGTDTRSATFHVERPAWTADAKVQLPAAGAGSLDLGVFIRPIPLALRIGCQDANSDGIRPARVTAVSQTGVAVKIDSASTDPGVCQPQAGQRTRWFQAFRPSITVGVGLGFTLDTANAVKAAKTLFVGIGLWHWPK